MGRQCPGILSSGGGSSGGAVTALGSDSSPDGRFSKVDCSTYNTRELRPLSADADKKREAFAKAKEEKTAEPC